MRPRILLVGYQDPGSPPSGSKLRFDATVRGLAAIGTVDYLQWKPRSWRRSQPSRPASGARDLAFAHHTVMTRRTLPARAFPAYRAALHTLRLDAELPPEVRCSPTPRPRDLVRAGLRAYDLVWCAGLASALSVRRADVGSVPTIVDLEDWSGSRGWTVAARRVLGWADRTILCNPDEARTLGPSTVVIENGAAVPPMAVAHPPNAAPRLLFVGYMHYPPNEEGAEFLVRAVVPELRRVLGNTFDVRIVGRAPARVHALAGEPNVTVTGFVADLDTELRQADIAIVPLLSGAGTRIKILEAFAHCVPVVSTRVGAAGLAVEHGHHLLLADEPADLAAACGRLLRDEALRMKLVHQARELVEARYDWQLIEAQIGDLASEVLSAG